MHVFNEQSQILVEKLNQVAVKETDFNIFPYITLCTLDIICGTNNYSLLFTTKTGYYFNNGFL